MQLNASTDKEIEGIFPRTHTHKHGSTFIHKFTHSLLRVYIHVYALGTQTHKHTHTHGQSTCTNTCPDKVRSCFYVLVSGSFIFKIARTPRCAEMPSSRTSKHVEPSIQQPVQSKTVRPNHTRTHICTYTQTHLRAPGRQREEPAEPQRYLRGDRQTPCKKTNVTKPARIDGCT